MANAVDSPPAPPSLLARCWAWWDSDRLAERYDDEDRRIDPARVIPFLLIHLGCLAVWWVGVSTAAVLLAIALFHLRMFAITAVFHRLLAHRSFKAPRWLTFLGAFIATTSAQRGPLWWAAHHRHHHRASDTEADQHRPAAGFWEAHCLWFLRRSAFRSRHELVRDWARHAELRLLDRFDVVAPVILGFATFGFGWLLAGLWPALGTSGMQCFVWGFCISTVACLHATFTINSLAHRWGSRAYATRDDSRNNWLLALLTLGEGWHNNHHFHQASARQGFRWYEIDITWYLLLFLQALGLVRELRGVPTRVLQARGAP